MAQDNSLDRRRFLQVTGSAAGVTALAGCLGDDDDDPDDEEADPDDTDPDDDDTEPEETLEPDDPDELNLILDTVTTVDPIESTDVASSEIINQVFENLVNHDNGSPEIINQLAEEVDVSDDNTTWTFTLREGVQFHNGDELTADDFVYSFRRWAEADASLRDNFLLGAGFVGAEHETDDDGDVVPESLGVEAVDDLTFELNITEPYANTLDALAYSAGAAVPEGYVGDIEGYDGEVDQETFSTEDPVGAGPYEFDFWEPGAEAEVTQFDDYHGDGANIPRIHWEIIEDDEAIFTYAMEQNADIFGIPTAQYDRDLIDVEESDDQGREFGTYGPMENDEIAQYERVTDIGTQYIGFNADAVPAAVREAVAFVTDHEEVVQQVMEDRAEPAWSFMPPAIWPAGLDDYEAFADAWPYGINETDRGSAEEVLEDAGITPDDPFELTFTITDSEVNQDIAELTQSKLAGTGIEVSIEEVPFSTLIERGQSRDLEMFRLGWIWQWPSADYGMAGHEPEDTVADVPTYYTNWGAIDTDAVDEAQAGWDQVLDNPSPEAGADARAEGYIQMEEALRQDLPVIPLYHGLSERFSYEYVDVPPFGGLGSHNTFYKDVEFDV